MFSRLRSFLNPSPHPAYLFVHRLLNYDLSRLDRALLLKLVARAMEGLAGGLASVSAELLAEVEADLDHHRRTRDGRYAFEVARQALIHETELLFYQAEHAKARTAAGVQDLNDSSGQPE